MSSKSIFTQEHAPHSTRFVNGFDNVFSKLAVGHIEGSARVIPALMADTATDDSIWRVVNLVSKDEQNKNVYDAVAVLGAVDNQEAEAWALHQYGRFVCDSMQVGEIVETNHFGLKRHLADPKLHAYQSPIRSTTLAALQDVATGERVVWDGLDLKSHSGLIANVMHDLIKHDDNHQLFDAMKGVDMAAWLQELGAEQEDYDALIVQNSKLDLLMNKLSAAMGRATEAGVTIASMTQSKPFKRNKVTQVAVIFEFSDGQSVSILFHNPDMQPNKLMATDTLISWKWLLNGRDVSVVIQPNQGQDVLIPQLAVRIMKLVNKNSPRFTRTLAKKDENLAALAETHTRIEQKNQTAADLDAEMVTLQAELDKPVEPAWGVFEGMNPIDLKEGDFAKVYVLRGEDAGSVQEGVVTKVEPYTNSEGYEIELKDVLGIHSKWGTKNANIKRVDAIEGMAEPVVEPITTPDLGLADPVARREAVRKSLEVLGWNAPKGILTAQKAFGEDGKGVRGVTVDYDESNHDIRVYKDDYGNVIIADDGALSPDEVAKTIDDYIVNRIAEPEVDSKLTAKEFGKKGGIMESISSDFWRIQLMRDAEFAETNIPALLSDKVQELKDLLDGDKLADDAQRWVQNVYDLGRGHIDRWLALQGGSEPEVVAPMTPDSFIEGLTAGTRIRATITSMRRGIPDREIEGDYVDHKRLPTDPIGYEVRLLRSDDQEAFINTKSAKFEVIEQVDIPAPDDQVQADGRYLQSLINGTVDFTDGDAIEAELTAISERLTDETTPLFEQAVDAYANYQLAQSASI